MKGAQDDIPACRDAKAAIHKSPVAGPALVEQQVRVKRAQSAESARPHEIQAGAEVVEILVRLKSGRIQIQLGRSEFVSQVEPKWLPAKLSRSDIAAVANVAGPDDGSILH